MMMFERIKFKLESLKGKVLSEKFKDFYTSHLPLHTLKKAKSNDFYTSYLTLYTLIGGSITLGCIGEQHTQCATSLAPANFAAQSGSSATPSAGDNPRMHNRAAHEECDQVATPPVLGGFYE
jgi:hypothetical protein